MMADESNLSGTPQLGQSCLRDANDIRHRSPNEMTARLQLGHASMAA
jgi:hypothetical protein